MTNRQCTWCGHDELQHWAHECFSTEVAYDGQCGCDGFCGREQEEWELEVLGSDMGIRRGQTSNNSVADQYSEIREHLAKVMDRAIKE